MEHFLKHNVKALCLLEYELQIKEEQVVNIGHVPKKDKQAL